MASLVTIDKKMNQKLLNLAHMIGIDKSIAYSSGSRIVGGVAGILSIFFITTFLTGVEQGFYYTFGSILAMQVFFELGLTGIMTQYVAHEVSHLTQSEDFIYIGEEKYVSRLASLIRFCIKWYSILALIVFIFLIVVGYVYFSRYGGNNKEVEWRYPWLLICIGTAIKLFQSPFTSIYMGLGKVKEMSKIAFYQQIIIPLSTWIGFVCGMKLYIVGVSYLLSVLIWQIYIQRTKLIQLVVNLLKVEVSERVAYIKEILPFQWRIALSWVSGYFIFQLFNPVLFATEGPVVAGQMGMTLQVLNAILSFSYSWINTKVPLYSSLIAQKKYIELDSIFGITLRQEVCVCLSLIFIYFVFLCFLNVSELRFGENIVAQRFLGYIPTLLMTIPVLSQQFSNSWAVYIRCHKKEPFLYYSLVGGLLSCLSTLILGSWYGLYGITIGYCLISIITLPWAYYIYSFNKHKWHGRYEKRINNCNTNI